jgi:hypothetical protein
MRSDRKRTDELPEAMRLVGVPLSGGRLGAGPFARAPDEVVGQLSSPSHHEP